MQLQACACASFSQQSGCQIYVTPACSPAPVHRPVPHRAASTGYISRRRQRFAAFHAHLISAATVLRTNSDSESYEQLLHALSSYSIPELRQYMQQRPEDVSLSFLQWLASREDELQGNAKLRLAVLAGQLLALREGLDPSGFDEVADGLQQQWQASVQVLDQQHNQTTNQQQQQPSNQHQQSSIQQIDKDTLASDTMNCEPFPSTPASLQQSVTSEDTDRASALNAFSQPNIVRQYEQVRLLNLDVQQAHAQSTVQLIGRKQISASDPAQVSGPAHRILEYLMGLENAQMRREVLPEAFESAESGGVEDKYDASSEGSDAETEQLSTTPLQLLQAVDLELARIRSQAGTDAVNSKLLIPAGVSSVSKMQDALQQLRTDVLAQWDAA